MKARYKGGVGEEKGGEYKSEEGCSGRIREKGGGYVGEGAKCPLIPQRLSFVSAVLPNVVQPGRLPREPRGPV